MQKTLRQFRKSIGAEERLGTGTPSISHERVRNYVVGDCKKDESVIDGINNDGYGNIGSGGGENASISRSDVLNK